MQNNDAKRLVAACFSSFEEAAALLRAEPHLLHARTGLGETALHYLAVENEMRAVQFLADQGAEINTVSKVGGTPVKEAALLGYVELVSYLLGRGAKLFLPGQDEPTLHSAACGGNAEIISLILGAGANIEEVDDISQTALHIAAEEGERLPALLRLVEAGANVSARDGFDRTPLDVAIENKSRACIAALEAHLATSSKTRESA